MLMMDMAYCFWMCFAGDYEVSIKFNDEHIPDSPFVVPVASPSDDARRLTVASLQVRFRERQTFVHPNKSQATLCTAAQKLSHSI